MNQIILHNNINEQEDNSMNFTNVPKELKETGNFCVWRLEHSESGPITKLPYNPQTGNWAKSNDVNTFSDYETAVAVAQSERYNGIGLGIFDDLCAIDIDHCVKDGALSDMAQDIIDTINAYTEYSPSGEGVRILCKAKDFNYDINAYYINNQKIGLEVYVAGATKKYVTVTGNVILANEYDNRTKELQSILDKYMKREQHKDISDINHCQSSCCLSDDEILKKARNAKNGAKFNALYNGEFAAYDSQSEADISLCNMLAFWCGNDLKQMDRLFRNSGLYRSKWDRKQSGSTYGQITLESAIKNCDTIYDTNYNRSVGSVEKHPIIKNEKNTKPKDWTDVGQAHIFVQECGEKIRYSKATKYLFYTGTVWIENELRVRLLLHRFTELQLEEALSELEEAKQNISDTNVDEVQAKRILQPFQKYHKFILSCRNSPKIDATLKEAQVMLEIDVNCLDSNGYKLNTPCGFVDLQTKKISEHNPTDYCTRITSVSPTDTGAELFSKFLAVITCGDKALEEYLQLIAGMFAVGKVFCENLVIAYGSGRNGKSTFFNLLARVMGDYAGNLSAETLTVNSRKNKSPEYAELRGKRLVIAAELEEGTRLDTAIMKKLCSTDTIYAEKKYKDPFSFIPSHTIVLYTNHLPRVGTSDVGTWRRLIVVPFNAIIEKNADIKNYSDYLFDNAGGAVLSWIIGGAEKFITAGNKIEAPEVVKRAIEEYRTANDWLNNFIVECCEIDTTFTQQAGELYSNYRDYCSRTGDFTRKADEFKTALTVAGYRWHKQKQGAFYYGLRLLPKFSAESITQPFEPPKVPLKLMPYSFIPPKMTVDDSKIQDFSNREKINF